MDERIKQIQKLLDAAEGNLHSARNLMREIVGSDSAPIINPSEKAKGLNVIEEGKIIEGVYNGESMVGPDGKEYPVPANYASKSKLVEGDVLKLTIAEDGSFIFKQIKPIERRKTIGTLVYTNGTYSVNADGKSYKVLQASVTYYKGEPGDQASIILPKDHESTWAAIENIVKADGSAAEIEEREQPAAIEAEETPGEAEKANSGINIEYPKTEEAPTVSKEDEEILQNLADKTVQTEPSEEPGQEQTSKAPEKNDKPEEQGTNQGIKELEI